MNDFNGLAGEAISHGKNRRDQPRELGDLRFRALVQATQQVVWLWDPVGANSDLERSRLWWAELTGQPIERQLASDSAWLEVVHPEDRVRAAETWARALDNGEPYFAEYRVRCPSGGWRTIDARGVPVRDSAGSLVEWVGTLQDVTAVRLAAADRDRLDLQAEALRQSEMRHRALVNSTSDVVYSMSADWGEMRPLDGRGLVASNTEPIRDWLTRNIPSSEHARLQEAVRAAIAEKKPFELEHQIYRADGSVAWTFSRAVPLLDEDGNIAEWFGMASDVTRRKQAEAELQDIRSRMEAALAAGAIGTWSWDVPADRFHGDTSLAKIFDLPLEDVSGAPLGQVIGAIHPDDRQRVSQLVQRVLESGDRYEAQYRVAHRDGTGRWVNARGVVQRDASGAAVRFPGVVIDVTDWKRAEEELARLTDESERRKRLYETILSNTPDLAYVFDLEHRFLYANEGLLRMWGRTWDESIGKTCLELGYEPWHAEMHNREIDEVRATRMPIRGEVPFHGTLGRRNYDYIMVPVVGADGEVEAVAGTTRDMTDRKAAEESIRDADRRKDDFLALLAHELRNPLAPIRNGLQVMRLAEDDAQIVAEARDMMERQLTHMVRLIDDLLDVSRITRNKMELRRDRVTLAAAIGSAVEAANPVIEEFGHELSVVLPPEPLDLHADLTRLAQVFANLLTNSAKYTPRGGAIYVSAQRFDAKVVVAVRDTGIGIPAHAIPRIFDMFSQVDRGAERSAGGLGIGLALVRGLVEMHGGTVTADSVEGQGSTFTVTLPLAAVNLSPQIDGEPSKSTSASALRVLVVDDNRDGADSMAMMLKLLGNQIATAHDGLEAVAAASAFRPDIILMDIGLPRLNGLDATREIRSRPWGNQVKIVALTGWGQENDRAQSRLAGCDGHLVKPVKLDDLNLLLENLRRSG